LIMMVLGGKILLKLQHFWSNGRYAMHEQRKECENEWCPFVSFLCYCPCLVWLIVFVFRCTCGWLICPSFSCLLFLLALQYFVSFFPCCLLAVYIHAPNYTHTHTHTYTPTSALLCLFTVFFFMVLCCLFCLHTNFTHSLFYRLPTSNQLFLPQSFLLQRSPLSFLS
jgi:hypothetical protein